MNMLKSKKALGYDVISIIIFLFAFCFSTIIAYLIYSSIINGFIAAGLWNGQIEITGTKFLGALRLFDSIIVIVTIALIVQIGIISYRRTEPAVFLVIQIIMAAIYGYVSYFFNFIFASMVSYPQFVATTLFFPKMLLICNNLHWVGLVGLLIGIITLYGKSEPSGGEFLG